MTDVALKRAFTSQLANFPEESQEQEEQDFDEHNLELTCPSSMFSRYLVRELHALDLARSHVVLQHRDQ